MPRRQNHNIPISSSESS